MEMVLEIVDMLLFPIAEPIKIILDAILKLVELIVTLVTAIPQILMAALQIFESATDFPFLTGGASAPNSLMTAKSNKTFFAKNGHFWPFGV